MLRLPPNKVWSLIPQIPTICQLHWGEIQGMDREGLGQALEDSVVGCYKWCKCTGREDCQALWCLGSWSPCASSLGWRKTPSKAPDPRQSGASVCWAAPSHGSRLLSPLRGSQTPVLERMGSKLPTRLSGSLLGFADDWPPLLFRSHCAPEKSEHGHASLTTRNFHPHQPHCSEHSPVIHHPHD